MTKHCADSIVVAAEVPTGASILDLGSGGGFPGIVVACVRPDSEVTLVDAKQRACSFLESVAARLHLNNVRVVNARFDGLRRTGSIPADGIDLVVSRGVNLAPFLGEVRLFLKGAGTLLLMLSGVQETPDRELAEAGFRHRRDRSYVLPTSESRRIAVYVGG